MTSLLFMLLSGGLSNAGTFLPVIKELSYLSPNRYSVESFFRRIIDGQ